MVHVDDEMPVGISSADNDAHEFHEVERLTFNFGRGSLRCVSAHSICKRMGTHKALHTAEARCEALFVELGRHI
jgi:hypothetical protein